MTRIGNLLVLGGLVAGTALVGGLAASPSAIAAAPASNASTKTTAALAAFDTIQTVLQHPRCQNCHIPGDAPLQFDAGLTHAQNVKRGPEGKGVPGLPCATCHAEKNPPASYGEHMPPGAPNWHLPPPERKMIFIHQSKADLCATIKDTQRNGGKDLAALLEHVSHDKLVLWGWNPGVGRAPVSVPHDKLVASFKTWIAGGAPCPAQEAAKNIVAK
jgi:cytochrome c5